MNIADIQSGSHVHAVFLVESCEIRQARNGSRFLRLNLRDRAGATIDAVQFQVSDKQIADVKAGEPHEVEGWADEFRNRVNIKIDRLAPSDEIWDATEYLPRSTQSAEALTGSIRDAIESIESPPLKNVLRAVIADPLVAERLPQWPAAKTRHHAWIGGLAEHTVEMLQIADRVARVYPQLDRDLLLAGVVLHDLGKLEELDLQATIVYTDAGNLEGHMVQGVRILDRALAAAGCDGETATLLRHLVLSHQGQLEFSAVTVPMLPEAIALHFIDQLSSQVRPAIEDVAAARERGVRGAMLRGPTAMRELYVRAED